MLGIHHMSARHPAMNHEIESFGHLMIARTTGQQPVRLSRSPDEVTFLAFDASIKRLVELHVLGKGQPVDAGTRQAVLRRAREVALFRGPSFTRILDVGEDQGLAYYTSNLNDGEFVGEYVRRIGPPPAALVFALVHQLLEDLIRLKDQQQVVPSLHLDRVLVTTQEDAFLQLRLYDLGLTSRETPQQGAARLVVEGCRLIFQLLTGREHQGENPDLFPAMTAVPMNLRTTMRSALNDGGAHVPVSLERLKDDVREAHAALVSSIQARTSRKQLLVTPALQPKSQIQSVLLENVPVETILGSRFLVVEDENFRRQPFSIPCVNAKNEQPVTVHLLPPSRIVDKALYEAVPLQMWRFDPGRHPNILRSLSLWESPDWTFLTEEREPGFSLSRLLAERVCLNPSEVLVLMRQVREGQEQALECGVERLDLHPSSIYLRVGKNGPTQARECERLMQKRVDVWPPFHVKLRAPLTLRNLYEPPLVDKPELGEHTETHLADRDYRHRVFIGLASYLLTGERQTGGRPVFPETMPEVLGGFICECLEKCRQHGAAPSPAEFLARFEELMNGPAAPDLLTRMRGAMVNVEEMESAGSVSDFDDDDYADSDSDTPHGTAPARLKPVAFTRKSSRRRGKPPYLAWAAGIAITAVLAWLLLPSARESSPTSASMEGADPDQALQHAAHSHPEESPPPPSKSEPVAARQSAEASDPPAEPPAPSAETPPPAPKPVLTAAQEGPQKTEAKLARIEPAEDSAPSAPVVAAQAGAQPSVEKAEASPPQAPATAAAPHPTAADGNNPPVGETSGKAGPRVAKPVPNPVIIRKAILPTPDEIAKYKQSLNQTPPPVPAKSDTPPEEDVERIGTTPTPPNLARP